jgi:hypothetical protein
VIPRIGVVFSEIDDVDVVDDALAVYLELTDGTIVAALLPIDEVIERAHEVITASDAPAMREAPLLQ